MQTAEHILLTGAGFTHNFGAPLAQGIWNLVLAHPALQSLQRVRTLLLEDLDYESVYQAVMCGNDYETLEKEAIQAAVSAAYEHIDEIVRNWLFRADSPHPVNIYGVWKFLDRFAGSQGRPGAFFTLNQDLFIERHCASDPLRPVPWYPCLDRAARISPDPQTKLKPAAPIVIPDNPAPVASVATQRFLYIKLHGSSNWFASDGSQRMVIGRAKPDQISQQPLLSLYLEFFESVLSSPKRLLVAGYGFGDEHINRVISEAIAHGTLQAFILSPQSPQVLRSVLCGAPHGKQIWAGLGAHFPYTLLDLFPPSQQETSAWRHLCQTYFAAG